MDLSVGVGSQVQVPAVRPLDVTLDPFNIVGVDDGTRCVGILRGHCRVHSSRWVAGGQFRLRTLEKRRVNTASESNATEHVFA